MESKRVILIVSVIGILVILFFGIDIWRNRSASAPAFDFSGILRPTQYKESPTKGADNPKVVIFEYADFNCAHCADFQSVLAQILDTYANDVAVVWKDFPFVSQGSEDSAVAARCAGKQDTFWEYHDWLFKNQGNALSVDFARGAQELGLNEKNFTQCLSDDTIRTVVSRDFAEGKALGIDQTPTLVIGDVALVGVQTFVEVEQALAPLLQK
ncbi:hypothetical protein BK004_03950 [bacterium CG10_46_32]|nr:MAG: hypothetical protein BK004_03950 [bacterium CG10_46_32]PIR55848.1 MAG: hypothetical protein COU73_03985 [Parcubacteria group bacterium CG10_big_fil_rev_8_21_14_0_10_46_32]